MRFVKFLKFFSYFLGFLLFVWIIRLIIIFPWTQKKLVYSDELKPCELIVVLAGEYYERIDHAFDLAEHGYSKRIFAPSLGYIQSRKLVQKRLLQNKGNLQFIEGEGAASTYEDALITKRFIKDNSISSIILVTSSYHSYRAQWIFKKIIPGIKIISAPVRNNFDKISSYFYSEQLKFLWYYIMYSLR